MEIMVAPVMQGCEGRDTRNRQPQMQILPNQMASSQPRFDSQLRVKERKRRFKGIRKCQTEGEIVGNAIFAKIELKKSNHEAIKNASRRTPSSWLLDPHESLL
mmetsp:Transcript_3857/g.8200  ORF Transcript_3857/g.8200 Transcript_3857/m.8200 type:complete len:103 (+) Transcript_3857:72-380(+)